VEFHLPSHGEPPSSIAAMFQGLLVVSRVGLAAILRLLYVWLRLLALSRRLAGSTFGRPS